MDGKKGEAAPTCSDTGAAYLEAIFRTMRHPLLVLDASLVVERANAAFCGTFDVSAEETVGQRLYDLGNGQWDIADLRRLLEEVLSEQREVTDFRVEHRFDRVGRRVMMLNGYRMQHEGGDRILLSIEDITEAERAQWDLEAQKEYAEKIVDASRDALLVLGWDLRVRTANETFYQAFGVTPADTEGRLVYDLGNGQWNIPALRELLENVLPDNNAFDDFEVTHAFEGIGRKTMVLNGRRIDHLELILLAIEDQTAAREARAALQGSEQRLRALVDATVSSVFSLSPDGSVMTELDGRGFLQDIATPSATWLDDLIEPADHATVRQAIASAVPGQALVELEHRVSQTDGSVRWAQSRLVPIRSPDDEIVEWFGAASDVSERRQVLASLSYAQRLEAVGRLAGAVAHDFNNLLTVIDANVELARLQSKDGKIDGFLHAALKSTDLGASLVKRLLIWSGRSETNPRPISLNDQVRDLRELLELAIDTRVHLSYDLADTLWKVHADPVDVDSALLNLTQNARDALPEGGEIRLITENVTLGEADDRPGAKAGDYVRVTICDDGVGMSEEMQQKIFDPFFTTKDQGTGLGLFSVRNLVEGLGGFIELESAEGRGTTVRLYLPRDDRTGSPEGPRPAARDVVAETPESDTVLLVEDQDIVRASVRQQLEALGYRVIEAAAAEEALNLLSAPGRFDLVFSDVILKGEMDGRELARRIRRRWPGTPVLLTSGYTSGFAHGTATDPENGFTVLPKPFRLAELDAALKEVLGAVPAK